MSALYSIHLSTAKSWRGGENQIFLLARGLVQRGHRVLVVAPPKSPLLERCSEAGVAVHALKMRGEIDPFGIVRLTRLIRREKPKVLHLHDGHAVLPGQIAARTIARSQMKVVAHRRTVFKLRGKWKYGGRVDRVVAISNAAKECVMQAGIPAERIRVVYSGLDFSAPKEASGEFRNKLGLTPDVRLIVHAAALTGEKRHADMLHVLAKVRTILKDKDCGNVHLALAGSGVEEQNLRELARTLKIQEQVHFAGFMKDVNPLWAAGCIAFYASEAEGLCTALIEAQAAGLPAIATRAGGMVEVVEEDITGKLVDVGDQSAMADRIVELLLDEKTQKKMGQAASERARRLFSAAAMVDGIEHVYEELWA